MSNSPESQDPEDLRITRFDLPGISRVKPGQPVPYGHVLYGAATVGCAPATIVSRLTALGYDDIELPGGPLPLTADRDDVLLLRTEEYNPRWHGLGDPVSLLHILAAAGRHGRSPAHAARRVTALGYVVPAGHALPETPDSRDIMLIRGSGRGSGDWLDWGGEVSVHHVLEVAGTLSRSPHAVARRLVALGLRLPYIPEPDDERILKHREGDAAGRCWLGRYSQAPVGHVLAVARDTRRSPADIAARLKELGLGSPVVLPDTVEADDLRVLSERLDGRQPWLEKSHVGVRLRHILRAALVTGRSPAEITERLAALGYPPHENAKVPEVADAEDIRLLEALDRSFMDNVHLEHVLRCASLTGRSPADVAGRLTALGYRLPDEVDYPEVCGALRR
ncbi:hypothetical protein ACIOJD_06620 [Streptomyces sp. NPDC088116]|uniref:wHTH domain-containing protein n=1 Tax=Streptomyces sp. NPDC088116 TaxID=3365825 RepID=UPI00382499CF